MCVCKAVQGLNAAAATRAVCGATQLRKMLCESSQKRRKPVAAYELLLLLQATGNRNLLTFNPQ